MGGTTGKKSPYRNLKKLEKNKGAKKALAEESPWGRVRASFKLASSIESSWRPGGLLGSDLARLYRLAHFLKRGIFGQVELTGERKERKDGNQGY